MNALLLSALLLAPASAATPAVPLPAERRHVYDLPDWVPAATERALEEHLQKLQASGGPRLVVVALRQPSPGDGWHEPFVKEAARRWGLCEDKSTMALLYVYCGWDFQYVANCGKFLPNAQYFQLTKLYQHVRDVMQREYNHEAAIRVGLDGIEALAAGRPLPTPPPYDPRASGWVKDEAEILNEAAEAHLNGLLAGHEKATSNQVVVLTVKSLGGDSLEAVSLKRATEMQIGQKGKDNGVLLFVAPAERKVRIEVGYGLEPVLTDARAAQIIRYEILPPFRDGNYQAGIHSGVRAIMDTITGTYSPSPSARVTRLMERVRFLPRIEDLGIQAVVGFFAGVFFLIIGAAVVTTVEGGKRWVLLALLPGIPAAVFALNYPIALVFYGVLAAVVLGPRVSGSGSGRSYSSGGYSSGGGGSWSGSSSSSSSSSSSFSGGGGRFGGGGASGSW